MFGQYIGRTGIVHQVMLVLSEVFCRKIERPQRGQVYLSKLKIILGERAVAGGNEKANEYALEVLAETDSVQFDDRMIPLSE